MSTKQLYEKTSEGMKEVSPLVAIEDIYSKLSDTPLEALVSLYNHVKCEWKGSVADTRRTVPLFLRRSGLFITYNNGTKYITEFFSAGSDQITTEGWVKDSNWTPVPDEDYISAGVKPGVGTIGYEQLSDNLKQLFREKVNVTNFPDDEDIASVDNMLKFKDREADAAKFQSKGYVILRKNLRLVNGVVKNILTQNMFNQSNTIYEIRYDFDLDGGTVNIPENCTLKFESGSLKNGTLNLNSTKLLGDIKIFTKVIGSPGTDDLYITWFGANTNEDFDNSPIIQMLVDLSPRITVIIPNGIFGIKSPILFDESTGFLKGTSSKLSVLKATAKMDCMLTQKSTAKYATPALYDFCLDGNLDGTISDNLSFTSNATCGIKFNNYWYTYCHDLRVTNIAGIALDFNNIWNVELTRIYISDCYVGFRLGIPNGESINNCEFVRIKYFGIINRGSANINITENIFEVIGSAAIYIAGGYNNISGNYFENTSKFGIKIGNFDNFNTVCTVHCPIFIEPRYQNYDKDIFYNGGSTPGLITVSSNSFQEFDNKADTSTEKYCLIYCGGCTGLDILNNSVPVFSNTLLGIKLNNGVRVKNVLIRNNIRSRLNPDGFPIDDNRFTHIEIYDNTDGYGFINNIITDSDVTPINLVNDLSVHTYGLLGFSQLDEYYKGDRVYCNTNNNISLFFRYRDPNGVAITDKEYTGWLLISYNVYNTTKKSWEKRSKVTYSANATIDIKKGNKFTMPKMHYLEANKETTDWIPSTTDSALLPLLKEKFIKGTNLIFEKDSIYKAALFIDDNNNYELIRKDGIYRDNPQGIEGLYTWNNYPFIWMKKNTKKHLYFDEYRSWASYLKQVHQNSVKIVLNTCKAIRLSSFIKIDNSKKYLLFDLLIYIINREVKYHIINVVGDPSLLTYGISTDTTTFYLNSTDSNYGYIHIEYFGMNVSSDNNGNTPDIEIPRPEISTVTTPTDIVFNSIANNSGNTDSRPSSVNKGFQYFDKTLNKPIWWTGTKWVDATGADV